ncbi:MAG: hypothetical protein ACRECT_04020 [Thermoplasmata archaeon]
MVRGTFWAGLLVLVVGYALHVVFGDQLNPSYMESLNLLPVFPSRGFCCCS